MITRILTGIQSSGDIHLGNILGSIVPSLDWAAKTQGEHFFFIADLHALTSLKDIKNREESVLKVAASYLAFGLDPERHIFYRQSQVPQVCELLWYLSCLTPFPMLQNAHSFKDKSSNLADVNVGLFTYPVLMAADILLYDAHLVPVGKDQRQHLEITRDIATKFNAQYGDVFVVPEAKIDEKVMTIPGTDGRKMSKSYHNYIDIFLPEKELKKQIAGIVTDTKTLEEPKDPSTCNVFALYALLADETQKKEMEQNYRNGNYGYGHAKNALFELILEKFANERIKFITYFSDPEMIITILKKGEEKARNIAQKKLDFVRKTIGF